MPLTAQEWLKENYPHPHDGFVIPSPEMVEEYARYYHSELSRPPKDVVTNDLFDNSDMD